MKPSNAPGASLAHHKTVFDGWRSLSLSLYMTLVGYAVLVGVPVISTAWLSAQIRAVTSSPASTRASTGSCS